ncbi:GNAT family N-acetyltransferase, partial [Holdemania massiliensis]
CYSERLELRPLTAKDAQDVLNIAGKDAVAKYMRFDTLKSYQEAVDLILQLTSGINQAWLVRSKQTLQAVGVLTLKQSDCETVRDVTLFLDEPFWHCGYGRELLSWAKVYAHDRLRASTLQAYVAMENKACQNLLESLHFQIEKRFDYEDQSVLVYRGS